MKKIIALLFSFVVLFSLCSCNDNAQPEKDLTEEATTEIISEETTSSKHVIKDVTEENRTEEEGLIENETTKTTSSENKERETEKTTVKKAENSDEWSGEQVADFYKKAVKKSESGVTSQHSISIKKISVNNGQLEGFFDFIMPVMSKLLENNSDDTEGITGGYEKLSSEDIASFKVYKSGENTAVEMTMKEQISGPRENNQTGSVGHIIDTVGDIGLVIDQLKELGMPLEISEKDTKIYYTNPTVKVLVDDSGKIINGTWKYTVEIRMDNYKAFGTAVETTSVIMDNVITVNGGFKK